MESKMESDAASVDSGAGGDGSKSGRGPAANFLQRCNNNPLDLFDKGYYVVEEIAEEDDDPQLAELKLADSPEARLLGSVGGGGDYGHTSGADKDPNAVVGVLDESRREFGNISPIPDDMSESGAEEDKTLPENSSFVTAPELSFLARINCSSPVLAHSPSLRKTPVLSSGDHGEQTPPSTGGAKRVRNFARALADISDREDDSSVDKTEDDDDQDLNELMCENGSSDEEKTESFEIDLAASGDGAVCLSGTCVYNDEDVRRKPDDVLEEKRELDLLEGTEVPELDKSGVEVEEVADGENSQKSAKSLGNSRTVWEALSENINAHIEDGNSAGFVSGPIDHPLRISRRSEPNLPSVPSYIYYKESPKNRTHVSN